MYPTKPTSSQLPLSAQEFFALDFSKVGGRARQPPSREMLRQYEELLKYYRPPAYPASATPPGSRGPASTPVVPQSQHLIPHHSIGQYAASANKSTKIEPPQWQAHLQYDRRAVACSSTSDSSQRDSRASAHVSTSTGRLPRSVNDGPTRIALPMLPAHRQRGSSASESPYPDTMQSAFAPPVPAGWGDPREAAYSRGEHAHYTDSEEDDAMSLTSDQTSKDSAIERTAVGNVARY
ncbi:hypothetical protein BU17DRAFT_63552 [Hysterangium stoloniferum]|nr:hypothetical protein BU17DRAFT_63552 [Hysterangium stoloniferum]